MNNKQETNKVVTPKQEFGLESNPHAYIISVHIRNMMATYGEQYVRDVLKELFLTPAKQKAPKKAVKSFLLY